MNIDAVSSFESLARTLNGLPAEKQNEFFSILERKLSKKEIESLKIGVSLFSIYEDEAKYKAMQKALGEQVHKEFNK